MLERQVRRMLRHPKAEALADNFAGQWLNLRALDVTTPLPMLYPNFDDPLRRRCGAKWSCCSTRSCARIAAWSTSSTPTTPSSTSAWPSTTASRTSRQPVPPRHARSRHGRASRSARQGRVPGDELEARPHVSGDARQVDHGQHPRHESAESAARRAAAAAARGRPERERADDAQEDGRPSRAARLRAVPSPDGSDRLRARELRRHRALAHAGRGDSRSMHGDSALRQHEGRDARGAAATGCRRTTPPVRRRSPARSC